MIPVTTSHVSKFKAEGASDNSVKRLDSYFTDCRGRVKLNSVVSDWEKMSRGCPQGSAFGPLLWSIYQNDLTYHIDVNLYLYADDNQFYTMSSDIEVVNDNLTQSVIDASGWYTSNFLKGNLDKSRILMLGNKLDTNINIVIDDKAVTSTDCLELLAVSIDTRLRFRIIYIISV